MDLTPNHTLRDLVKVERLDATRPDGGPTIRRVASFPEILKDEFDHYVGIVTLDGERIEDPMVAFLLDLIRWGYTKLESQHALLTPLKEGEELDVPDYNYLPHEIRRTLNPSRPLRQFFEFQKELPPGVKWSKRNEKKMKVSTKNFRIPTLCQGTRGLAQVYCPQSGNGTGFDAACLWAIQMGHSLLAWDNGISNLRVDDSAERLAFLKGRMTAPDFVKVVEDSGWGHDTKSSIPHRGINDFNRQVRFERKPTEEEMGIFKEMLSLDKCPGWTGIYGTATDLSGTTYRFRTTWDSSD